MFDNKWFSGLAFGLMIGLIVAAVVFVWLTGGLPGWWKHDGALVTSRDTLANWLVAIFSLVAAVFLWLTLLATQNMAKDARRIGEAQVKAYLEIKLTHVEPQFPDHGIWLFRVKIKNSGQSPARQIYLHIKSGDAETIGKTVCPDLGSGDVFEGDIQIFPIPKDAGIRPDKGPSKLFGARITVRFLDVFYGSVPERIERRDFHIDRDSSNGEAFRIQFAGDISTIFKRMEEDPTFVNDSW